MLEELNLPFCSFFPPFFFYPPFCLDICFCPVSWPSFSQALAVRQMAMHLALEYFGILDFTIDSMTARCPGFGAAEQETVPDSWYEVFVLICLGFLQTWAYAFWSNVSTLV